jgi:alkanesulfonate monooxygenase SsuD/methylene tetrahydromethanopterin reductase-like flavin-dependent oxidoreductase (luciferase family)
VYIDTAKETGFTPGPEHFGYLLRAVVADSDEKAIEIGRQFMWTENHRARGPREHNDPPGYQSREALKVKMSRPTIGTGTFGRKMSYDELRAVDNIIVGNPDTVIKKLTEIIEHLNPATCTFMAMKGRCPTKTSCGPSSCLAGKLSRHCTRSRSNPTPERQALQLASRP